MIRVKFPIHTALLLLASSATALSQTTIMFDDVPVSGAYNNGIINNGYNGLNWNNFYVTDGIDLPPAYNGISGLNPAIVNGGFYAGVVSGNNVGLNGGGSPAQISSGSVFNLISAYFTAAWNNGLNLEVQGFDKGVMTYDVDYTLSATAPTLLTFDFLDVDEVNFISSGGTAYAPYKNPYGGTGFAVDNLTIQNPAGVPDAAPTSLLFGASLASLAFLRKKLA